MTSKGCVLITGGAGYIGSHAALDLLAHGWRVVVLDNLVTGLRGLVPREAEFVHGDAGDAGLVTRLILGRRVDAIMHFAAATVVPESLSDPLKYYGNNTCVSRTLLGIAVACGVDKFIFSSTAAVYGDPERLPVDEDQPTRPVSPYGTSKLMVERMLADLGAASPLRYVALRYFNVAGADPALRSGQSTPNATHLIKVACEVAVGRRDSIILHGDDYDTPDGTCVRDYIHVSDLAAAHVAALEHLCRGGDSQVLNCGYGWGISVRQVIEATGRLAGKPLTVVKGARRPGDVVATVADSSRLRRLFGWKPRHDDIDTIVGTALAWERRAAGLL